MSRYEYMRVMSKYDELMFMTLDSSLNTVIVTPHDITHTYLPLQYNITQKMNNKIT